MGDEIVVIGAGQCRTGTASLQVALQRLLGGRCYHMKEVFSFKNARHIPQWIKAVEQRGLSDTEWRELFAGYKATVDYPGAPLYQNIFKVYPKAKVVLSVRDPKSWVKSCKSTVFSKEKQSFGTYLLCLFTHMRQLPKLMNLLVSAAFGDNFDIDNEATSIEHFNDWNDSVKSAVPSDQLLVFEAKEGWEPLCNFLGVPVPDEPYPNINSTDEFQEMIKMRNRFSVVILLSFSVAVGGIAFGVYRFLNK